jgi:hypothetical protein
MPDPTPRLTFGELAKQALAADPAARTALLIQLARGTRTSEQVAAVADLLLAGGKPGPAVALEWLPRVRPVLPDPLIARVVPLLSDRTIPASLRVVAAARLIRDLPDRAEAVRPVVRAITTGLSPLRGLERLRHLQHQVDRGRALDVLIDRREQRVKMDCPRCRVHLPRMEMVKHLWHAHGVFLDHGKVRGPARLADDLKSQHASTGDPTALDRAVLLAGPERTEMLRHWVIGSTPPADDTAPLLAAAEERRAGLCPGCLTELPAPVRPLPPPLALADGRLAGDGYAVEVGGASWFRVLRVETPERELRSGPDRKRLLAPRGVATLAALVVLLGAAAAALFIPRGVVVPFVVVFWGLVAASAVYTFFVFVRRPLPSADDRAVDAAWAVLARRLIQKDRDLRFLTRLCRTSLGRGDPVERVGVLTRVVESAAKDAPDSEASLRLLAAAQVLQIEDGGRDRLAAIAGLAADGFRGHWPVTFAEYVADAFSPRDPTDPVRLRVLLIAAAFDGGLRPRDLIDLWAAAPALRRTMAVEPLHRLGLLYGLWALRHTKRWERVAPAETVFDLGRTAAGGRLLKQYPDLLLAHYPDPDTESDLGPVLVCGRGVVVGGAMTSDPDADVRVMKAARGGYEVVFGRHRLKVERRPPDSFSDVLRGWLKFRATVLLPYIDGYLEPGAPEVTNRVLGPFRVRCERCGSESVVAVGKIGTPVTRRP